MNWIVDHWPIICFVYFLIGLVTCLLVAVFNYPNNPDPHLCVGTAALWPLFLILRVFVDIPVYLCKSMYVALKHYYDWKFR
jgi:hypothetical protein